MTIPEFVERLKTIDTPWVLDVIGIRTTAPHGACPICAVAAVPDNALNWWLVYQQLGLTFNDALTIARTADAQEGHDPALRQQLLAATVQR